MSTSVCFVLVLLSAVVQHTYAANLNDCNESTLGDLCGNNNDKLCVWNRDNCNSDIQGCRVVCAANPCAGLNENHVCGSGKSCQRNQAGCGLDHKGCRLVCKPVPVRDPMGYYGTNFVTGFMQNVFNNIAEPTLMITCAAAAIVRVEIPYLDVDEIYTVTSYQSLTYSRTIVHSTSGAIEEKAVFISSDVPIMVYLADLGRYFEDGTVIIPIPALTNEYFIAGYPSNFFLGPTDQFVVIGVSDNTMVTIEYKDPAISLITITLNQNQTYYEAGFDLSGTSVVASSPIAVLSGNRFTTVTNNGGYLGMIMEAMPPVTSLDTVHVVSYMKPRPDFTISIVVTVDLTQITIYDIDGNILEHLTALMRKDAVFRTYTGSKTISIVSSAPVMIHQYRNTGTFYKPPVRPSIMFVPGVRYYGQQYEFVVPHIYTSSPSTFTLAMVLSDSYATASLKLNGQSFTPTQELAVTIPDVGMYKVFYVDVLTGFNTLACDIGTATIGAWLYGNSVSQRFAWSLGYAV